MQNKLIMYRLTLPLPVCVYVYVYILFLLESQLNGALVYIWFDHDLDM